MLSENHVNLARDAGSRSNQRINNLFYELYAPPIHPVTFIFRHNEFTNNYVHYIFLSTYPTVGLYVNKRQYMFYYSRSVPWLLNWTYNIKN